MSTCFLSIDKNHLMFAFLNFKKPDEQLALFTNILLCSQSPNNHTNKSNK